MAVSKSFISGEVCYGRYMLTNSVYVSRIIMNRHFLPAKDPFVYQ